MTGIFSSVILAKVDGPVNLWVCCFTLRAVWATLLRNKDKHEWGIERVSLFLTTFFRILTKTFYTRVANYLWLLFSVLIHCTGPALTFTLDTALPPPPYLTTAVYKWLSTTDMYYIKIKWCRFPSCYDTVVYFNSSNRQWKSRATTSHTSFSSPESARVTKDCMSAGWHGLTTARLSSTKPKPGWRSTPRPGHDDQCRLPRKAPHFTWQTRNRESPAPPWARITWVQTRGWLPPPPPTHPPIQLNTTPAQVRPYGTVT